MASLSSGCVIVVVILVLLHLASTNADFLEIMPHGDVQSKPSGSRMMLTCKPKVDSPNLITNMQWLDPLDRVIESRSTFHTKSGSIAANPDMYTEMHQDNSLSLVFNPLKEEQAGRYICIANYANTEHFKESVQIDAVDAIRFLDAPENQYPILGEEFKIKCRVSARPPPTVEWYRDGVRITTDNHYIIETHALKIIKVEDSDEGVYTCHASVYATGELQVQTIRVEVHERPVIEDLGPIVKIVEGKNENIGCNARGKPSPKISWVKSLTKENLTMVDRFGVDGDTGIWTITNVHWDDAGEYECIAKNDAGRASTNIVVNVIGKPKIMEFSNRTVAEHGEIELTCRAFGRPAPEVVFRKQTSPGSFVKGFQPGDDRISLSSSPDNAMGETVASLSIRNSLRKDDGIYECIATNEVASAYMNGHLTVEFLPSFASMSNRTEYSWNGKRVNLTCIAESIPNATIRWMHNDFEIPERLPAGLSINAFLPLPGNGPISILTVKPYDKRYYGNYKCIATNRHGEASHTFRLKEAPRPEAIQQATMSEISPTTVSFKIIPPGAADDFPLDLIAVQYKKFDQLWTAAKNRSWSLNSTYVLEDLEPATEYLFKFRAENRAGPGQWSKEYVEITPQRNVPSKPKILPRSENQDNKKYDVSLFPLQYELSWIKPLNNGEEIDQSEIRVCKMKRVSDEWEEDGSSCRIEYVRGPRSQYYIRDLDPDTFYRAEVRARNILGYGEKGAIIFKTNRERAAGVGNAADDRNSEEEGNLCWPAAILHARSTAITGTNSAIDLVDEVFDPERIQNCNYTGQSIRNQGRDRQMKQVTSLFTTTKKVIISFVMRKAEREGWTRQNLAQFNR